MHSARLEVKARLCTPSKPRSTPFYTETSVTKINEKAWLITEGCGDHWKNSGKGESVTDGKGRPQTGVGERGLLWKTASCRPPITGGDGKKWKAGLSQKATDDGSQKTTENLRTENRKEKRKKLYG